MKQFDQFRQAGKDALDYSRRWLSHRQPTKLAYDFTDFLFQSEFGKPISEVPSAIAQSVFVNSLIAGRWAASGFPTVTLGHRTAAAFCGTKMRASDAAEFVKPPWPAFCIRLPSGLLTIEDHGVQRDAEVLMVTALSPEEILYDEEDTPQPKEQHRWYYKLGAASELKRPEWIPPTAAGFFDGICLWGFNMATHLLAYKDPSEAENFLHWETQPTMESDTRSDQLARALLISTCMYLCGDPRERAERASENGITIRERKSKYREGDLLPQYTEFEVTSSIKVNLHHAVRDFVARGGSSPTVQTHVAGHWKRVAYGVGRAHRKMMHIQPYWRGDLNAPISARVK